MGKILFLTQIYYVISVPNLDNYAFFLLDCLKKQKLF